MNGTEGSGSSGYPLRVPGDLLEELEELLRTPGVARLAGLEGASRVSRSVLVRLAIRRGAASMKKELLEQEQPERERELLTEARKLEQTVQKFREIARALGHMTEEEIEAVVKQRVQQAATLRRQALTGVR